MINKKNKYWKELADSYNAFLTPFPKAGYYNELIGEISGKLHDYDYETEILFQKLESDGAERFSPYDIKINEELDEMMNNVPLDQLNIHFKIL